MSLCEQHQRFPQGTLSHGSDFCGILQLLCCSKPDPTPAFLAGMIHPGISGERSQQQLPVRKQSLRDISSRDPAKAVFSHTESRKKTQENLKRTKKSGGFSSSISSQLLGIQRQWHHLISTKGSVFPAFVHTFGNSSWFGFSNTLWRSEFHSLIMYLGINSPPSFIFSSVPDNSTGSPLT